MMSLSAIHELSEQAARRARREGKRPTVFTEEQLARARTGDISAIRSIANLGDYLPKGWVRVRLAEEHGVCEGDADGYGAFFVDKSGFGRRGEPALTLEEFIAKLKPGLGYAMVEEGQFQVKVGVFAVRTSGRAR